MVAVTGIGAISSINRSSFDVDPSRAGVSR